MGIERLSLLKCLQTLLPLTRPLKQLRVEDTGPALASLQPFQGNMHANTSSTYPSYEFVCLNNWAILRRAPNRLRLGGQLAAF